MYIISIYSLTQFIVEILWKTQEREVTFSSQTHKVSISFIRIARSVKEHPKANEICAFIFYSRRVCSCSCILATARTRNTPSWLKKKRKAGRKATGFLLLSFLRTWILIFRDRSIIARCMQEKLKRDRRSSIGLAD